MKIYVEDNIIKIRKEGLFLCLDSRSYSKLWEDLYDVIKTQCGKFDIPFKIGLLNWDEELQRIPDELFILSNYISERGRFITPLVERVFPELDNKDYDLLLLSSEKIYDIEDWQDEIQSKFNKLFLMNPEDLDKKTRVQLEEQLFKTVFDFRIDKVALSMEDSICYDFSDGFEIKLKEGKFIMTKDYDDQLVDIHLKTCGVTEDAVITVSTASLTVHVNINHTKFSVNPNFSKFDDEQTILFHNTIDNYKKGEIKHYCHRCKQNHDFAKAFVCNKHNKLSPFTASEYIMFDNIETERKADSRYAIIYYKDNGIYYKVIKEPVCYLKDGEFIAVADQGNIYYIRIFDKIKMVEFQEIYDKLYYSSDGDIYILVLR